MFIMPLFWLACILNMFAVCEIDGFTTENETTYVLYARMTDCGQMQRVNSPFVTAADPKIATLSFKLLQKVLASAEGKKSILLELTKVELKPVI